MAGNNGNGRASAAEERGALEALLASPECPRAAARFEAAFRDDLQPYLASLVVRFGGEATADVMASALPQVAWQLTREGGARGRAILEGGGDVFDGVKKVVAGEAADVFTDGLPPRPKEKRQDGSPGDPAPDQAWYDNPPSAPPRTCSLESDLGPIGQDREPLRLSEIEDDRTPPPWAVAHVKELARACFKMVPRDPPSLRDTLTTYLKIVFRMIPHLNLGQLAEVLGVGKNWPGPHIQAFRAAVKLRLRVDLPEL